MKQILVIFFLFITSCNSYIDYTPEVSVRVITLPGNKQMYLNDNKINLDTSESEIIVNCVLNDVIYFSSNDQDIILNTRAITVKINKTDHYRVLKNISNPEDKFLLIFKVN